MLWFFVLLLLFKVRVGGKTLPRPSSTISMLSILSYSFRYPYQTKLSWFYSTIFHFDLFTFLWVLSKLAWDATMFNKDYEYKIFGKQTINETITHKSNSLHQVEIVKTSLKVKGNRFDTNLSETLLCVLSSSHYRTWLG